jgi:carboxymethylenebutenolidase
MHGYPCMGSGYQCHRNALTFRRVQLASERLNYPTPAGSVAAYLSRPAAVATPLPGVLVIQEVWGADEHICDVAERIASAGYIALAPDLYSAGGGRPAVLAPERVAAGKEFLNTLPTGEWMAVLSDEQRRAEALSVLSPEQASEITETLTALFSGAGGDSERHLSVLRAALAFLRSHPACQERPIGSVGFCLGGSLSGLLACHEPLLGAAVIFYGSSPPAEQTASMHCPLRGFYGHDDPRIVNCLPDFQAALTTAGIDHELRIYPDTGHAFFNDTRPSHRPEAARDAWARTLAFFAATLAPTPTVAIDAAAGAS